MLRALVHDHGEAPRVRSHAVNFIPLALTRSIVSYLYAKRQLPVLDVDQVCVFYTYADPPHYTA